MTADTNIKYLVSQVCADRLWFCFRFVRRNLPASTERESSSRIRWEGEIKKRYQLNDQVRSFIVSVSFICICWAIIKFGFFPFLARPYVFADRSKHTCVQSDTFQCARMPAQRRKWNLFAILNIGEQSLDLWCIGSQCVRLWAAHFLLISTQLAGFEKLCAAISACTNQSARRNCAMPSRISVNGWSRTNQLKRQ